MNRTHARTHTHAHMHTRMHTGPASSFSASVECNVAVTFSGYRLLENHSQILPYFLLQDRTPYSCLSVALPTATTTTHQQHPLSPFILAAPRAKTCGAFATQVVILFWLYRGEFMHTRACLCDSATRSGSSVTKSATPCRFVLRRSITRGMATTKRDRALVCSSIRVSWRNSVPSV